MIKILCSLLLLNSVAHAYVPTVESLFRHGANPEVTANGVSLSLIVKKNQPGDRPPSATFSDVSLLKDERPEDYYKIFYSKSDNGDTLKIAQSRYNGISFLENTLQHKTYYPNFTPYTIKPNNEELERGLFFGLLQALVLNDGGQMVGYLKSLGVSVRLNSEIINREKVEFLARYKSYLSSINKDRNLKKSEVNPMRPEDSDTRARVKEIMGESMYVDTKQVKLSRDEGQVSWMINAGPLEASFSYKERQIQRIRYRSSAGDIEMICKDYWLANGTHSVPRYIILRGLTGQTYQVEITNLRHYNEKDDNFTKRLTRWDEILKDKEISGELRPEFML